MRCLWSQDIKEKLRKDYFSTLVTELVIWPGYQVDILKVLLLHECPG